MHRTEGLNNLANLFQNGPPGTVVEEDILNAIQEEIAGVIEAAGITLLIADTDTRDQLPAAISILARGASVGFVERSLFAFASTTSITIGVGTYQSAGSSNRVVYWDSDLTFVFGSGGSNAASSNLTASAFHYLYIDDSSISGNELDETNFLNSTVAPTFSNSKRGWYNGNDRCICAFRTTAGSLLEEFFTDGGDYLSFAQPFTAISTEVMTNAWEDVQLIAPNFVLKPRIQVRHESGGGTGSVYWKTKGATITDVNDGHNISGYFATGVPSRMISHDDVICNSSQVIEMGVDPSGSTTVTVLMKGWSFPKGM